MMHILLVEDDEFFSVALKGTLENAGFKVTTAENGKMGIFHIDQAKFDCVLSDVQMPVMGGMEFAKWVKDHHPQLPFIMMTGYSDSIATLEAVETGAVNLLYKPFSADEILRAIKLSTNPKLKSSVLTQDGTPAIFSGYARIPKHSLMASGHAEYNLYIPSAGGLEKIISRGEAFRPKSDTLTKHSHFYTEKENLEQLIPINIMITKAAIKSERVDPAKKAQMIQQNVELLFEKIDASGFDERAFGDSVEFIKCFMETINDAALWDTIAKVEKASNYVHAYTLATTAVATMIAQAHKMTLKDCFKVATSAMFHDVGKSQIDAILLVKPKALLSVTERALLERHVDAGIKILKQAATVPDEIIQIVQQHHENCAGTGYPSRLKKEQIHPIARLLFVADEFCSRIMKSPGSPAMLPANAIEELRQFKGCDQEFTESLASLIPASQKGKPNGP